MFSNYQWTILYNVHVHTFFVGDVFAVIAEPWNHEGVNYYLLWCIAERKKLYDPEESDEMLFPIGIIHTYACTYMNLYIST